MLCYAKHPNPPSLCNPIIQLLSRSTVNRKDLNPIRHHQLHAINILIRSPKSPDLIAPGISQCTLNVISGIVDASGSKKVALRGVEARGDDAVGVWVEGLLDAVGFVGCDCVTVGGLAGFVDGEGGGEGEEGGDADDGLHFYGWVVVA